MAFENVDVSRLRSSLQSCLDAIDHTKTNEIISSLNSNDVWESKAKGNLKTSLETLTNKRYNELEEKLKSYIELVENINNYKAMDSAILSVKYQRDVAQRELNIEMKKAKPDKNKVSRLKNQIRTYDTQLNNYNNEMSKLFNNVNGKI